MNFCNIYNFLMTYFDRHTTRIVEGKTPKSPDFQPRKEINVFWGIFVLSFVSVLFILVSIFYILHLIIKAMFEFTSSKAIQFDKILTSEATKNLKCPNNEIITEDDILWK